MSRGSTMMALALIQNALRPELRGGGGRAASSGAHSYDSCRTF